MPPRTPARPASQRSISLLVGSRETRYAGSRAYRQLMSDATWIGIGTLVTAIVGLSLVGWQIREQRRALRAEFGNLYIERYWQIDDDLLIERKGSKKHRQHRHRYLRLFEDEFDVAHLGFLDAEQWQAWHSMLNDSKVLCRVKDDLRVCNPEGDEFRRLRACVKQREQGQRSHTVAKCMGNIAE